MGFDGAGIQRYDLVNSEWLTPWDQASNALDSDGVTSLALLSNSHILWAGGDLASQNLISSMVLFFVTGIKGPIPVAFPYLSTILCTLPSTITSFIMLNSRITNSPVI